jgi:hypothetical protein
VPEPTPTQIRAVCPTCGRDFALLKSPNVRSHDRPHADEPWRKVGCEGSGQPPARTFPADAPTRAAAYREAAERLRDESRNHGHPAYNYETGPGMGRAADRLTQWADEIHPA